MGGVWPPVRGFRIGDLSRGAYKNIAGQGRSFEAGPAGIVARGKLRPMPDVSRRIRILTCRSTGHPSPSAASGGGDAARRSRSRFWNHNLLPASTVP